MKRKSGRIARGMARRTALGLAVAGLLAMTPAAADAVSVYPTAVFIDSRTRTATLTLTNDGLRAEEIDISFVFGVPTADPLGVVRVTFLDSVPNNVPSVVPFIRAFPMRMRLEPGQTQVVRLLVQPPAGLPHGEYWGRVMVASVGGQAPIEQRAGDIAMQINIRTVIAIGVYYRNGQVETSLAVTEARTALAEGRAQLFLSLDRGGNAAMLGRVVAQLVDPQGTTVATHTEAIAVHDDMLWRIDIPLPEDLPLPGSGYTVQYVVEARRDDMDEQLLRIDPIRGTVPFTR